MDWVRFSKFKILFRLSRPQAYLWGAHLSNWKYQRFVHRCKLVFICNLNSSNLLHKEHVLTCKNYIFLSVRPSAGSHSYWKYANIVIYLVFDYTFFRFKKNFTGISLKKFQNIYLYQRKWNKTNIVINPPLE